MEENKGQVQKQGSSNIQADAVEFEKGHLASIPPSYDPRINVRYYPASVELTDGSRLEKVIFVDRLSARRAICSFDWLEASDNRLWRQVQSVDPSSVESVFPSEHRMPSRLVSEIYKLESQRRHYKIFITKDGCPLHDVMDRDYYCLGQYDFPKIDKGYEVKDIASIIGFNPLKKELGRQIKEYRRQRTVPPHILDDVTKWELGPEIKVKTSEPWEIRYCVFPPNSEDDVVDRRANNGLESKALNRNEIDEYSFRHSSVAINGPLNKERKALLENSPLVMKRESVLAWDGSVVSRPAPIQPDVLDPHLLQKLGEAFNGQYLARVTLVDGTLVDNVVIIHEGWIKKDNYSKPPYMSYGGTKYYIKARDIADVGPCPNGIPTRFREKLPLDTCTNCLNYGVLMNDGSIHALTYGGYNDFIDLPPPYTVSDIERIEHSLYLPVYAAAYLGEPVYAACVIKNDHYNPSKDGRLQALRNIFTR